jgi:3-oxo-5-alpha-steroid 4-dehydrogenase 3
MPYGSRATSAETPQSPGNSWIQGLLNAIAGWKVPHSFFVHFYIVSVLSSAVWGFQLATRGAWFRALASTLDESKLDGPSMTFDRLLLCWTLLAVQGIRRLLECRALAKPSESKMWVGHWLFGLVYYLSMGIAIWIEGTGMSRDLDPFLEFRLGILTESRSPRYPTFIR